MSEAQSNAPTTSSDADAWLDKHGDALFRYAMFRVRDSAAAEDLVQETLLAALRGYDKFQRRGAERTWLIGILKHKIVDHFRRSRREAQLNIFDDWFVESEFFEATAGDWNTERAPTDWRASPNQLVERISFWKAFNDCLAHMPARTATVFTLREFDGLQSDAICETLGITVNNLGVLLHRARMHLRNCLEMNWFKSS
jgi:RNA polymerase sigma-70 factor (TIGR02943 family)